MPKIKAVIFDMDGVLIDAKDWHYEALNKALKLFGMEISRYDHLVTYDGLPTKQKLQMLTLERGLPEKLHGFINQMKQIYTMQLVALHCKPSFHHEYALSRLKRDGFQIAVASNSIRQTIDTMLTSANLSQYINFSLSNQDVTRGKPDPEIYTKAIERLGFAPSECLVVEDNHNGKLAAKASGAWLMEVLDVSDVNYANILQRITNIEEGQS